MQSYYNHYWGMNYIWWIIWGIVLFWIFVTPYSIPGQRSQKESPLHLLKRRLASGEISNKDYEEKKALLEKL